jgi:hypothetical protein
LRRAGRHSARLLATSVDADNDVRLTLTALGGLLLGAAKQAATVCTSLTATSRASAASIVNLAAVSFGRLLDRTAGLNAWKPSVTGKLRATGHDPFGSFAFRTGRLIHRGNKPTTMPSCSQRNAVQAV